MEKERKIKTLSLVALIVAVLGLTVAFAALSQTLTINGTASVDAATWDVHFEGLTNEVSGGAKINGDPVVNGTSITGINATLTKPNDYALFMTDIQNAGTINAKISSVEISKLCTLSSPVESCDWDDDGVVTQEDINNVNDNISFVVIDVDDNNLKKDDVINSSESLSIVLALVYNKCSNSQDCQDATELPKRNLQFNDLSVTINYVQAD